MPTEPSRGESSYFIDAESAAEMARLVQQGRLLTKEMGKFFFRQSDFANVHDVLDIGCGPGEWVLDVAYEYPDKQVTGIDISRLVIEYAQAQVKVQWLSNVHFRVMDALKGLEFPDNSFDLVNARFLFGFMSRTAWPQLLQECKRITRPGGFLQLTECESPLSNSYASERLYGMIAQALQASGKSFSPDGRNVGMVPVLGRLLRDAGYQDIEGTAHVLDCSAGMEAHNSFYQDFRVGLKLLQPFLVKMNVTTPDEFEELYEQALADMQKDDFCALWYYLTVSGERP